MFAKIIFRFSVFVWACNVPLLSLARNVLSLKDASSTEMNPDTPHPVIGMMEEQKKIVLKGGTMRLGAYPCDLKKGSKAATFLWKNAYQRTPQAPL